MGDTEGGGYVDTMTHSLVVSELFGPTIQGEGPSAGRRAAFLRTGRCNLDCSWCDTPYTWDWRGKNGRKYDPAGELATVPVVQLAKELEAFDAPLLVITGGEPLLQAAGLDDLLDAVIYHAPHVLNVEIETNGTRPPILDTWPRYNVSPKLSTSGVNRLRAWHQGSIEALLATGKASWKFVVANDHDRADVLQFVERFAVPKSDVWIMPEGRRAFDIALHTFDAAQFAVDEGFNFSSRLHILAWGDERGR